MLVLVCPLSHDVVLNFELLRTVGRVASTFECELGCQCLYENGVNLQVSEVCVYATYLVVLPNLIRGDAVFATVLHKAPENSLLWINEATWYCSITTEP